MSPEKAKVFVAEDDSSWQEIIEEYLTEAGHTVVAKATTRDQALSTVSQLKKLGVDVAIIDGNLNDYESEGYDGQAVLRAIKDKAPNVKTVGMSGNSVRGTDVDLGKLNAQKIGKVVKDL